ncbi:MAG TPA: hypothetical protein VKA49_10560 [Flavitalea sp.]|nr:hypothetical protein [Flavitalea sp.]
MIKTDSAPQISLHIVEFYSAVPLADRVLTQQRPISQPIVHFGFASAAVLASTLMA